MQFPLCVKRWIGVFAIVLCAATFCAAQMPLPSVDHDLFGTWLDRADRSVLREEWDAVAGRGEEAAMVEWEREALLLLESGGDPDSLRDELETLRIEARQEIEDVKNRRLVDWLMTRFVRDNTDFIAKEYIPYLKETRNQTMFVMKDGKIERDATGKAVQTTLESEAAFTEELSRWQHGAAQYFEGILSRSKSSATTLFTDLLSSLDDQTRSLLDAEKDGLFYAMEQSQKRQGDLLLRLEQSEYRYFRLRDQYSLRLDSENASAESQAENLIEKTRASLQEGLDRIEQGLDDEIGDVVHEGYLVDRDGWRDAFRDEFAKGLALWDAAEEDFFVRRVEWERQAGNDLADGMDAWKRVFEALKEEQHLWLDEMDTLRKKGEDAFRREFDELTDARTKALAELDASIMENRGDLVERVESTVENLNRSLEMMNTARNSMDYWLSDVSSGEAYDLDLVSWSTDGMLESFLNKMVSDILGNLGGIDTGDSATKSLEAFGGDHGALVDHWITTRIRENIVEVIADVVTDGSLLGYLRTSSSGTMPGTIEEWKTLVSEFMQTNIQSAIPDWFDDLYEKATIGTVFTDHDIGVLFGFERPTEPQLRDYNTSFGARDSQYQAALKKYNQEDLPAYTRKLNNARSLSLSVLFEGHATLKKDVLEFSGFEFAGTTGRREELDSVLVNSVGWENYEQAWYWYNTIYVHYAGEAEKQNEDLEKTYGLVVFDSEKVPHEGYADDETIRGPIAALDEYGWESICLDDYQLELVKARAVEAYWKKEVDVAEAVYTYATDETYARDTEAETLQRSEAALSAYNAALAAYHEAVAALEVVTTALGDKRGEIEAVRAEIAQKQEALAEAKREYADMIIMAELDTADFYVGQFRAQYEQLLSERGLLEEPSWSFDELGSGAKTYLGDVVIENCSAALAEAVNGNVLENPPLLSLAELGRIASLREQYTVPEDLEDVVGGNIGEYLGTQLGLGSGEYWYAVLEDAYEKRTESSMEELLQLFSAARHQLLVESKAAIDERLLVINGLLSEEAGTIENTIFTVKNSFGLSLEDTGLGRYDGSFISFTCPETLWNNSVIPQQSLDHTVDWLYGLEQEWQDLFGSPGVPDALTWLFEQWFDCFTGFVLSKAAHERGGSAVSEEDLSRIQCEVEHLRTELDTIHTDALRQGFQEGSEEYTAAMNAASDAYIRAATGYELRVRYNSIALEETTSFRQYLAELHEQSTSVDTVCAETGQSHAYSTDGTVNVGLEYAAFLREYSAAFETLLANWTAPDEDALKAFNGTNAALATLTRDSLISDPESGAIAIERVTADGTVYSNALAEFLSHIDRQKNLAREMGKTASSVVAFLAATAEKTAEITTDIRGTIEILEGDVNTLQTEWADLIGVRGDDGAVPAAGEYGEATYAELERAYSARYEEARSHFESLEDARQEYKIARAVYEYATTPYLGIDAEKTTEDEYVLIQTLDAVDPDTRLAEAREKHLRSVAAREAIEAIDDNDRPESLYKRDERYRDLRDSYEKQYRFLLASKQMQVLLDKEIQKAHGDLATAKNNYEVILASIQNLPDREEDGSFTDASVKKALDGNVASLGKYPMEMLRGLTIDDGVIHWGSVTGSTIPDSVYSDISTYLTASEGLKSEFIQDLAEWLMVIDQSDLNAMSNALSWEIFSRAGGMTYEQYVRDNPPKQIEITGQGVPPGATRTETEYEVQARWKALVRNNIWDNLLGGYTDGKKSGDLWDGFKKAYSIGRKYRISETGLIDTLFNAHTRVSSTEEYSFFKFVALTGLLGTEIDDSPLVSTQLVNSLFSQTLFYQLGDHCQKEGRDSWFDKPAWHNRRDEANEASGSAALDYRIATGLSTAATNLQKAQLEITEKQAVLDLLTGTSVEGGPGVDNLVTSLVAANDNGSGLAVRDILKTAGIVYNEKTLEEDLRRIIASDDAHETLRESDSSKLLATIIQNLTEDFGDSERALSEYLYSNSTEKPGVARTHAERRQEYAKAVSLFIEAGMLPDNAVSEEEVKEWEALLRLDRDDTVMADVLAEAEWFLSHTDGIDSEQQAVRALAEVLDRYTSYADLKKAEGLNADTVHGRALASDVYGAFTALVQSYRIGIDYLDALEAALEEPVFDPRENALRECELFRAVLGDLKSETSGLGTYVLGSVTEAVKQSYIKLNDVRMSAIREARVNEWDIQLQELNGRHDDFNQQMNAIYSRGMLEWRKANRSITAAMEDWQQEYEDSFKTKAEDWTNQYITFLQKKEAWVDTIAEQAVQIGNNEILRNMGAMTRDAIADATTFIIPDVIELPDTDSFLASIVDRDLLSGLLSSAGERNRGIDAFTPAIFQSLKRNAYNSAETLDRIRIFQTEENEEIAARLAFIQYDQALTTLKDAKKSLEENIDGANRSTWAGFRDMFIRDGFTESGGNFIKNTTVGATLMDNLQEKHVIEGYRYFKTTVKDFTKGIMTPEEIDFEAIGATGIQALLDQAMGAVDEESKRIFGSSEDTTYEKDSFYAERYTEKKYRLGSETGERIEYLVEKVRYLPQTDTLTQKDFDDYMKKLATLSDEQTGKQAQQVRYREVRSGEFNTWVGYAPVFRDDAKPNRDMDEYWKNVRFAGAGETGRIMGLFTQHKMIESSGRAEANMPAYSRRLWDDRGSFMPAPTIRTLVDVAMTVAVSCFTGGAGGIIMNALISTAFNMIDDAVFTLMDMANGMDLLDAVEGFSKKAATTFASSAISGASSAVAASNSALTSGVIGSTMLKGTEVMASNVASSAINSINLRGLVTGGDAFDEDAFNRGAFGRDAMAGVASGMAGNAVTVGMRTTVGSMDFKKFNVSTGDIDFNQINKLGALAGSAASAMVQYGMTGETTVNVLNAHTLAGLFGVDLKNKNNDAVTTGLFGLTFGKDGVHGSITMSGYAMDVADIMVGLQAFDDISAKNDLQRDVNNAARERDRIKKITDRVIAIGEVSYEGNTDQASSLLAQLQGVRSLQSKDNLHSMFQNKAENGYSESRLDENLDLAFKQHDISVTEFMNSAEFDTVGSFKHAMTFYNRSVGASKAGSAAIKQLGYNVTLEDMFSTGKAYAGKITDPDNQSRMIEQKKDLLNKYYAKDIAVADNFMGRSDVFDAQTHMNNRIVNNKMNLVGQDMAAVAGAERDRLAFMKNLTTLDGLQAQHKKDTPESPELLAAIETFYATQEQMFKTGKVLHQYAKEFGLKFNFGTGYNEAANSAHNADKSAYSPVYNSGRITTLHGHNAVDPDVAAATGREFGQDRGHPAFDVSGGLFVALEKGTLGMNWVDKEGIQIVLTNGSYQHTLGHNFTATADRLMELCVTNGTLDVEAGTVIGQYQAFKSNASTGPHVHWSVAKAVLGENGKIQGYENIPNSVWADRKGLTDVFQPTVDAMNYSGLKEKLSPAAGRQLYKKNNPEIYYNWLGKVNFGVPVIDSEEEYTYWEENLPHRKKASKQ